MFSVAAKLGGALIAAEPKCIEEVNLAKGLTTDSEKDFLISGAKIVKEITGKNPLTTISDVFERRTAYYCANFVKFDSNAWNTYSRGPCHDTVTGGS